MQLQVLPSAIEVRLDITLRSLWWRLAAPSKHLKTPRGADAIGHP